MLDLLGYLGQYICFFILHVCGGGSFPKPLSAKEERLYLERSANGDMEARNKLVEHNLRLVAHIIKKYYGTQSEQDDLVSIGTIGLIKAINTYDINKNIRLSSYASRCIENEILMHLRKISGKKQEISIDEPLNTDSDGNELVLSDVLGSDVDLIQKTIDDEVDKQLLNDALSKLSSREREIISLRFGLSGEDELTQKEVASILGISQSYISRLEKRIIKRLKKEMEKQLLAD